MTSDLCHEKRKPAFGENGGDDVLLTWSLCKDCAANLLAPMSAAEVPPHRHQVVPKFLSFFQNHLRIRHGI
jgi:hypothetical protein